MANYDVKQEVSDKYSLRGRVFHKLREDILNGRYKDHEELREVAIGEELGVSRTPIREAIRMLEQEGLAEGRLICVHKPFMERRLYAAMKNYWPEAKASYTSPQLSLEEYIRATIAQGMTEEAVIDVIVGDFQRMDVYAVRGYQIPQEIPESARDAFDRLVKFGFTKELVSE